jgi:hypothetical protein
MARLRWPFPEDAGVKQKKISIRIKPKKQRKEWGINPVERVHDDSAYNRKSMKQELRKTIDQELDDR